MYQVTLYKDVDDAHGTIIHFPNRSDIKLTSGTVAQGINVVDSFTFEMNMANPAYTIINSLKSLVTVYNTKTNKFEFDGYVLNQNGTYDEDGSYHKTVVCVSGLNYLTQSKQRFGEFHDMTPKAFLQRLIDVHNSQVESYKHFQLGNVTVTNSTDNVYRYTDQEVNTLDTIFDKLVDRLGGEIRARRENCQWYLDWEESFGLVSQTEIRVGRNLKSANRDENTDEVFTRWMVYGAEIESDNPEDTGAARARITIADVNGGKDYLDDPVGIAQFGIHVGHVTFDDVNNKTTLKTKGQQYIDSHKQVKISNVVTALDLSLIGKDVDSYEVYNHYPLDNQGLSAKETVRIIEKRIDINNPQSNSLTIGDKYNTSSQYQASINKNNKIIESLQKRVDNQTSSIVSLRNSNGEITNKYNQIQTSYNNLATTLQIDDETGTSVALGNLQVAIDNLGTELSDIPVYSPVTATESGLMIPEDKIKLDELENYTEATQTKSGLFSMSDKSKLDLISVENPIDLNDLLTRIEALETPTEI